MSCETSMYGFLKKAILDTTKEKLIFYDNKLKGNELFNHIDSLAFYLQKIGIQQGDVVGILLPNIPHAVVAFYAANSIGAIANVIHPKMSPNALLKILVSTNTKVVFMFEKLLSYHKKLLKRHDIKIISCSASDYLKGIKRIYTSMHESKDYQEVIYYKDILLEEHGEPKYKNVLPYNDAVYLHSGGTTSEPKIVKLSSYAFNKLADNVIKRSSLNHDYSVEDSMLMVLPIFHGFGLGICVHLALANFKVVMMPKFNAREAIKLIKKHKINYLAGIPVMFEKLLREKSFDGSYLASLQLIFCGSDRLSPKLKEKFDKVLKNNKSSAEILEGYGLSEVASVATFNVTGESKVGTQGKPLCGVKLKIIDNNFKECKPNTNGEVLLYSQSLMNGYLDYKGNKKDYIYIDNKGQEWLRTGDIGCVDKDGYFIFKGRQKRIIKIAGENIFPSEIEELVCDMPEIDQACVVRAYKKNKPYTKLIIKMNKKYKYSVLIKERIISRIAEEFIYYAIPREIMVVNELYMTNFGKVDYRRYEKEEDISYH